MQVKKFGIGLIILNIFLTKVFTIQNYELAIAHSVTDVLLKVFVKNRI